MLKISQVTNFPSLSNWIKAHSKPYNDHVCVGCDGCGRTVGIGKWNHSFIRSCRVRINTHNVDNKSVYSVYEGSVPSLENGNSFAIFFDRRKKMFCFFSPVAGWLLSTISAELNIHEAQFFCMANPDII